jgi:hypothetical protein
MEERWFRPPLKLLTAGYHSNFKMAALMMPPLHRKEKVYRATVWKEQFRVSFVFKRGISK